MYYINFWANYWKRMAELGVPGDCVSDAVVAPVSVSAPSYKPQISPEDKYAYLTEYGTQILALFAADGSCTYLSRNIETITGHAKHAGAGQGFYAWVADENRERLQELIRLQHSSATPQVIRARLRHANQKQQWYMFMLHPKKHEGQEEVVCVFENIHDNILTQNSLQKARMEAELALRARSEFLANMSHNLRTPLNAVLGFSQMMTDEVVGAIDHPQYMEYARHIQESGYDLLSKIEDLLEIADLDAGHVTLERSQLVLGDILKQLLDAQTHHAHNRGLRLVCDATHHDLPLYVDRMKIQHVLGHLVSNAIQHCSAGQQINIRTSRPKEGGLKLRVSDNGSGMDGVRLQQIQTALAERCCWTSKQSHGIGLGLALAKELVELHGGHITIESQAGQGTTVELTLPRDCVVTRTLSGEYAQALAV